MTQRKQNNPKTLDERIEQARKRFREQCESPNEETMRRLLVIMPESLNSVVESQVGALAEDCSDNTAIGLGVQLFVRISRQFPALPAYVVVDVVMRLGNLHKMRDQFVEALEHLEMI